MPWKKLLIVRSFLSFIQMFSGPQMETSQLLLWNSLSTSVSGLSEPQAKRPESRHPFSLCWGLKLLFLQLKESPSACIWPESGAVRSYDCSLWAIFLVLLFLVSIYFFSSSVGAPDLGDQSIFLPLAAVVIPAPVICFRFEGQNQPEKFVFFRFSFCWPAAICSDKEESGKDCCVLNAFHPIPQRKPLF